MSHSDVNEWMRWGDRVVTFAYPGIFGSAADVGTQNMDAITPSVVGPTMLGGPHEGLSSASLPSTHWRDAPNGRPGLTPYSVSFM